MEKGEQYIDAWKSAFPHTEATFKASIEEALDCARSYDDGAGTQTLITGSLHLVGGALELLDASS